MLGSTPPPPRARQVGQPRPESPLPARRPGGGGVGRPVDRGAWAAKTVKRPPQQPAHPQYANYWAPLTRKRHIPPHSAQPRHTNDGAPRTRKRHQQEHRPQRPTERSDPTQHAEGRTSDCPGPRKETTTRRNVTRGGGGGKWAAVPSPPPSAKQSSSRPASRAEPPEGGMPVYAARHASVCPERPTRRCATTRRPEPHPPPPPPRPPTPPRSLLQPASGGLLFSAMPVMHGVFIRH